MHSSHPTGVTQMTATTTTNNNGDDDDEKSENDRSFCESIAPKTQRERTSNKFGNGILQPRKEQIERGDTIAAALFLLCGSTTFLTKISSSALWRPILLSDFQNLFFLISQTYLSHAISKKKKKKQEQVASFPGAI